MSNEDLARHAVGLKHWRVCDGMRLFYRNAWWRVIDAKEDHWECEVPGSSNGPLEPGVPDLDDPATLGCLLALVREAWGDATVYAWPDAGLTTSWCTDAGRYTLLRDATPSEAEALVAALEAAP